MAMLPIKYLTIHCAATREGARVTQETIREIGMARFGQPSYHLVIDIGGKYYRQLADSDIGAHVGGHNSGNIGICYIGGLDKNGKAKDTRTEAQKVTMRTLIRTYRAKYPNITIRGHRDWPNVAKDCPCFDVGDWIAKGMPEK